MVNAPTVDQIAVTATSTLATSAGSGPSGAFNWTLNVATTRRSDATTTADGHEEPSRASTLVASRCHCHPRARPQSRPGPGPSCTPERVEMLGELPRPLLESSDLHRSGCRLDRVEAGRLAVGVAAGPRVPVEPAPLETRCRVRVPARSGPHGAPGNNSIITHGRRSLTRDPVLWESRARPHRVRRGAASPAALATIRVVAHDGRTVIGATMLRFGRPPR